MTGYFGAYAVLGTRGAHALEDTDAALGVQQERLAILKDRARLLQHRIELMNRPDPDSDLVEELARGELLDGAPEQVAIRRDAENARQ